MGSLSVYWFVGIALVTVLSWLIGVRLGRGPTWLGRWGLLLAGAMMIGWGWLVHHPSIAVSLIPLSLLSRIEGVGGVPVFMFILGIAWARSCIRRQRLVISWAMLIGTIYFVNGGMWLLQQTPSSVMGQSQSGDAVLQSQDYSCVPAACATALNLLNMPSTEAQMAEYTQTRPGTGATMIRALHGLRMRLIDTTTVPVLLEPEWDTLSRLPMPALTPLQFEATRRHMVTLTDVGEHGVWMMDPMDGSTFLDKEEFLTYFRGQVIVFDRP